MDLEQLLTTLFGNDKFITALSPIIEHLRQNSFDIKKALASINPDVLKPIVQEFIKNINNRPTNYAERTNGLKPISNIADKDIIFVLNKYLSQA